MALDLSACPWIVDRQQLVPAGPSWLVHVDDHQLVGGRLDPQSGQVSRWQPSPTLGCQGSQGFIISILFLISSLYITMSSLILNFFYFVLEDTIYFAT